VPSSVMVQGRSRLLGWHRPAARHRTFAAAHHFASGFGVRPQDKGFLIAHTSNNEHLLPPVFDQGDIGSCVANAGVAAMQAAAAFYKWPAVEFSRLYLYAKTRHDIMGLPLSEDSGSTITDMVMAAERFGCAREQDWPYLIDKYDQAPPSAADAEASKHQLLRAYALSDLDWILAALSLGFPVVFGFDVPEQFISETGDTGQLQMPLPHERFVGGHAVVAWGFDDGWINDVDDVGALYCRNSWGKDWGQNGNFRMPFSYVRSMLATDFWTLHQIEEAA